MTVHKKRVAILGATGHVGKCLVESMSADARYDVVAVARDSSKLETYLASLPNAGTREWCTFDGLEDGDYDAIVNCVGEGSPAVLTRNAGRVFELTQSFDALVMRYLDTHRDARCVCFSSGAAYGGGFARPATEDSMSGFAVNRIQASDAYGVAKFASEARHRSASDHAIVDLRLFGFFSRHIDLSRRYFMNDVAAAISGDRLLRSGESNIVRDYVAPSDLADLVASVLEADPRNDVFDVYSASPVSKFEILEDFAQRYSLSYCIDADLDVSSATGAKFNYYSTNRRAAQLGYTPQYTSLEALRHEMDAVLKRQERR